MFGLSMIELVVTIVHFDAFGQRSIRNSCGLKKRMQRKFWTRFVLDPSSNPVS